MPPKAAKQAQEASRKKTKKQKRKAVSPLNDVAGTTAVGGEPNISSERKVKTKYDIEQPLVVPIVTRSVSISCVNLNMNNTGTMSGSTLMPGQGGYVHVPIASPIQQSKLWSSNGGRHGPHLFRHSSYHFTRHQAPDQAG